MGSLILVLSAAYSRQETVGRNRKQTAASRQQTGNGKQKAVKFSHTVLSLTRLSLGKTG